MSERYGQIATRIDAVRQLGAVVNVMRGTAATRVARAREELDAVAAYARVIGGAIQSVLTLVAPPSPEGRDGPGATALVAFGAEQGFVGGFTERLLDGLEADEAGSAILFLVGTRAGAIAAERGIQPVWDAPMPLHDSGIPRLADRLVEALFELIGKGGIDRLEAVWNGGASPGGDGDGLERRRLFPLEPGEFASEEAVRRPLLYRPPEVLLQDLTENHVHAQLCDVALRAFVSENEARMAVMAAARRQVDRQLDALLATQRQLRQQEITAEIVELSAGILTARDEMEPEAP